MKAVVEDVDQTFKLNNIFIGLSKKNTAESVIQKKIRKIYQFEGTLLELVCIVTLPILNDKMHTFTGSRNKDK